MGLGMHCQYPHRNSEDTYEIFKASLDRALLEMAESNGEKHEAVERAYNDHWPDGLTVCISRDENSGFTAAFSSGETLRFKDFDDMGAALLIMRNHEFFKEIEKMITPAHAPAGGISPTKLDG